MFTTTMAALTMTGMLASGAFIPGPNWTADYAVALNQSAEQGKPIAVFIASGSEGYTHVLKDGPMPTEATRILKDKFVCLFVDTATESGKGTAGTFEIKEGLVISSKGGKQQALRHDGSVTADKLNAYLVRFAESGSTVATTESNAVAPAAAIAPANYSPYGVVPAGYNPFGSGGMGGSCPSCRGR